jgi:hypothetical protein
MRSFLFTTSVLDRVNPSLARQISGFDDAELMLREAQERFVSMRARQSGGGIDTALFAEAIRPSAACAGLVQRASETRRGGSEPRRQCWRSIIGRGGTS